MPISLALNQLSTPASLCLLLRFVIKLLYRTKSHVFRLFQEIICIFLALRNKYPLKRIVKIGLGVVEICAYQQILSFIFISQIQNSTPVKPENMILIGLFRCEHKCLVQITQKTSTQKKKKLCFKISKKYLSFRKDILGSWKLLPLQPI